MIESLLASLDTLLLLLFAAGALAGALLMIVLRQPMRVATALISTMVFLGGIYGLLGVHFIAAFQVLIYVGAVMVFMVYVIMLLDPRDPAIQDPFSKLLVPGVVGFVALVFVLVGATWNAAPTPPSAVAEGFGLQQFAVAFLREYWLQFIVATVLMEAAIVAAVAVVKLHHRRDRG
jgi:NADH-quinone oxidoreductase subunit J